MTNKINQTTNIYSNAPKFWGIVNITPDSFSDGGLFLHAENALKQMQTLLEHGADYIDIGAASSRPSSGFISTEEEWARLEPLFDLFEKEENSYIISKLSVDTWRADIAEKVLAKGVPIINDISAFSWDFNLLDVLIKYKPYYVLMHCKGTPDSMQNEPTYENVVEEVYNFFEEKIAILEKNGFPREKIILDQGIGFGKTQEHNLALLNASERFRNFELPLMAAVSRKSLIRKLYNIQAEEINLLDKTTATFSLDLYERGYTNHRVHNIKECMQAIKNNG